MLIASITKKHCSRIITLNGRINNIRYSKNLIFLEIGDASVINNFQVVSSTKPSDLFLTLSKIKFHDFVSITGTVMNHNDSYELRAHECEILNKCTHDIQYPIQPKKQSPTFLRNHEALRIRVKLYKAIFQIRAGIIDATHSFFTKRGFFQFNAPIITPFDAEGAGEAFSLVDSTGFFNKEAFLSVSSQLYAEAMAQSFYKIYVFGPTFRANQSKTSRHAAEFWMIEPEWITQRLDDVVENAELLIKFIASEIIKTFLPQIKHCSNYYELDLEEQLHLLVKKPFTKITYKQALIELNNFKKKNKTTAFKQLSFGAKITKEHELTLCDKIFHNAVFITHYPTAQKAFYMAPSLERDCVLAVDLLLPKIGELLGGSLRTANYNTLCDQLAKRQINPQNFEWYLNLRQQRYVQTGGFGLGLERLVMYITGATNIKDVIVFPRMKGNLNQ